MSRKRNGARDEVRRDEAATDQGSRAAGELPSRGVRPEEPGVTAHDAGTPIDLAEYSVQTPPPSKVPPKTKRIFDAPLDDAMLARIKARVARDIAAKRAEIDAARAEQAPRARKGQRP